MSPTGVRAERQTRLIGYLLMLLLGLGAIGIVAGHRYASDADDAVARGRWTAETHCGGCHNVARDAQADRRSGVPSFVLVAQRLTSPEAVAGFLGRPHAVMPPAPLSAEERGLLAAYIASLAPPRR